MITVSVHLHTILQKITAQGLTSKVQYQCRTGQSLAGLMVDLAIEYDDENLLLVANGQVATPHYVLEDGDEIHLIPAISGG